MISNLAKMVAKSLEFLVHQSKMNEMSMSAKDYYKQRQGIEFLPS